MLNLPPDVAKQRQLQAMQRGQVYSIALQIFLQRLDNEAWKEHTSKDIAHLSLKDAYFFVDVVNEDGRNKTNEAT